LYESGHYLLLVQFLSLGDFDVVGGIQNDQLNTSN